MKKILSYFSGSLNRLDYLKKTVFIIFLVLLLPMASLVTNRILTSDYVRSNYITSDYDLLFIASAFSLLMIPASIIFGFFNLAFAVRRTRNIMSPKTNAEVGVVITILLLLSIIVPIAGQVIAFIWLFLLPGNFTSYEFYKNYLENPITNITNAIINLTKKKIS